VLCVNERLKPTGVLETIRKGVANHHDMVAGLKFQFGACASLGCRSVSKDEKSRNRTNKKSFHSV